MGSSCSARAPSCRGDRVTSPGHELLAEQKAYYRARAAEYDEWWERTGALVASPAFREWWEQEKALVYETLLAFGARGNVLELAAGTGNFTRSLVGAASSVTAVDASEETLAIAAAKVAAVEGACPVELVVADLFEWRPNRRYDVVFFSFWLSHVPSDRFDGFWSLVADALQPDGRVFFVDNAHGTDVDRVGDTTVRTLNDGSQFRIVKRYWDPPDLVSDLGELGWDADVRTTPGGLFLLGSATRTG